MCSCSEYKFKGHLNSTILKHSVILKQLERILFSKTFFFIFEQDFIILFYNRSIKASSEQRGTIKSFFIAFIIVKISDSITPSAKKRNKRKLKLYSTSTMIFRNSCFLETFASSQMNLFIEAIKKWTLAFKDLMTRRHRV